MISEVSIFPALLAVGSSLSNCLVSTMIRTLRLLPFWLLCYWLTGQAQLVQSQYLPAPDYTPGGTRAANWSFQIRIYWVQLTGLNTITRGAEDGYQDYDYRQAVVLDRGHTYTPRLTTGPSVEENARAWLDFNQDNRFDTATEQVLSSVSKEHAATFIVTATVPVGARLRIATDYINSLPPTLCNTPQYSQSEDYQVIISAILPSAPRPAFGVLDTCTGLVACSDQSANTPTS